MCHFTELNLKKSFWDTVVNMKICIATHCYLVSAIEAVVAPLAIALVWTPTPVWFTRTRHLTQVWVVSRRQSVERVIRFASYPGVERDQLVFWYRGPSDLCQCILQVQFELDRC